MSQQFEESKHPRETTGKFATKGYAEAAGGTDVELSMPEPVENVDVERMWADAGIETSHESSLAALRTMADLANSQDPEAARLAREFNTSILQAAVAFRDQVNADPEMAKAVMPASDWRDERERLDVARGAYDWVQRYADKHEVDPAEVIAELNRAGSTIESEMVFLGASEGRGGGDDPRLLEWGKPYYSWQFRCNDAAQEAKRIAGRDQRVKDDAQQDIEWAERGQVRCPRCGGVGGSKAWRDYVCYECGGHKSVEGKPEEIEAILNPPSEEEVAAQLAELKAAEAAAEEAHRAKVRAYAATQPAVQALIDLPEEKLDRSQFLSDLYDRVASGRELTQRQLTALHRVLTPDTDEQSAAKPVPTGRVEITGEVTTTKWETTARGGSVLKMRVKHADGWAVWGACPSAIEDQVSKGAKISFAAEVTPSREDTTFGFYKRPTKAKILP